MQRNRIMYFIIGMVLIAIGYVVRVTGLSIVTSVDKRSKKKIKEKRNIRKKGKE